ncbi:MAG: pallilysin-related adhesin, partial [Spirochaetia bacterium]|nr:pallilysin-related adhesin [Spirochaetia bacterium]
MRYSLILLFFVLIFTSCNKFVQTETVDPQEIIPVYQVNNSSNENENSSISIDKETKTPKVTLDPDDFIIDIIDTNLDLDSNDEQILIVKNNVENNSPVRVLVADFDNIMNSYFISWEGITGSDNIKSLSVSLIDITGDHNLEIVCTGTDLDGKKTINIFRRTPSQNGIIIHFSDILNLSVDGNIEIKEEQRSQAYQTGISDSMSFPIIVTTTDENSKNILDMIKKTYFWRNQEDSYKLISIDKIPGNDIENSKLHELYRSDRNYFKSFLNGPWMLSNSENNLSYNNPIVYFDTDGNQIVFSNNDFLEIYLWETSSKTLSNTLQINCKNDLVPFLDVSITVRVLDITTISLKFRDNSIRNSNSSENQIWTGNYFKLNTEVQKDLIEDFRSIVNSSEVPVLSGYYRSDTGDEFSFNSPKFSLKSGDQIYNGGFYLFNNGQKIAEFKMLDENNLVKNILTYKYDYFEEKNEQEIIRTIIFV